MRQTEIAQNRAAAGKCCSFAQSFRRFRRHFWTDETKILNVLPAFDDNQIIDLTNQALGSVLPDHMAFRPNDVTFRVTSGKKLFELQEVVVAGATVSDVDSSGASFITANTSIPV